MNYKCKKCGEQFVVDEKTKVCPHCGTPICEENDASGAIKAAHENKIKKEADLKALVAEYGKTGSSKDINTTVQAWDELTQLPDFNRVWRDFIINAAGEAVAKRDKDLQLFLKNHARDFDSKRTDSNLYLSLLQAYPKVGSNNDWDELIRSTQGNQTQFAVLCDSIISYIVKANDKAFAIDIFNLIKAKGVEWVDAGRIYIRALLSSEEVAAKVFSVQAITASVSRFVEALKAYCKKYLEKDQSIAVEQTKVWENHIVAVKKRKKRTTIIALATLAAIVVAAVAVLIFLNSVNGDTIEFVCGSETLTDGNTVKLPIEVIYGQDKRDFLQGFTVTYKKNSGETVTEKLEDKLVGYKPDVLGEQHVTFEFNGAKIKATIIVKNAQLSAPVLGQNGNYVTWDTVPNASTYQVYVNNTAVTEKITALSYDLSDYTGHGNLSVTVRAYSVDSKYSPEFSQPLAVTKLQAPNNVAYSNGKLTWNVVDGADYYELVINNAATPIRVESKDYLQNGGYVVTLVSGDNTVSITAVSNISSTVHGKSTATVKYNKLAAVDISTVKYQDGKISWGKVSNAQSYEIFVNGTSWKTLDRNNINVQSDGFDKLITDGEPPKITIISKTNQSGFEQSVLSNEFRVATSVKVQMNTDGDALVWNSLGEGFTYNVTVNGTSFTGYNESRFSLEQEWNVGQNTVSVSASKGGVPYICETVIVSKLAAPDVTSVSDDGIKITGSAKLNLQYKLDDGDWTAVAPTISGFADGEYIVLVRSIPSDTAILTLPSDETEIKIVRAPTPSIEVKGGKLVCDYDSSKYTLVLEYAKDGDASGWKTITSVDSLTGGASYNLRAHLVPNDVAFVGYKGLLSSANSREISVEKPAAPDVSYDKENHKLSSTSVGAQFYYVDESGEQEILDGDTTKLQSGTFTVYARINSTQDGVLNSENTPADKRVSVVTIDITLRLSVTPSNYSCTLMFIGSEDMAELTYTYKVEYYDANGNLIGQLSQNNALTSSSKDNNNNIVQKVPYYNKSSQMDAKADGNKYVLRDIASIKVLVYIGEGTEPISATATI